MAGIYSQGGSAGHRYAGWLSEVEAKNFQFGGMVFNGSPSAIYVGSNLVWAGRWLTVAAAQAILGAFGQTDGKAVIKATNAYLNQLAASDPTKATALAGFINEDPMMVCSLGLQPQGVTMPERYIVCDKKAYIQTPFLASKNLGYRIRSKSNSLGTNTIIYGGTAQVRLGLSYFTSRYSYVTHYNNTFHIVNNLPDQMVWHTFEQNIEIGKFKVDGTTYETWTWGTNAEGGNMHVPTEYIGERPDSDISFFEFWDNQTQTMLGRFIPCKHKVNGVLEAGWLDIVSVTWYGNIYSEGQFTIPDISYTPSTP